MPGAPPDLARLEAAARAIVTGGPAVFTWTWDDRFRAALSSFPRPEAPRARALLTPYFAGHWPSDALRDAPAAVQAIAASLGGLRAGQELFLADLDRAVVLCACWWPWGDGMTVSLRVTLSVEGHPLADRPGLAGEFRAWCGL